MPLRARATQKGRLMHCVTWIASRRATRPYARKLGAHHLQRFLVAYRAGSATGTVCSSRGLRAKHAAFPKAIAHRGGQAQTSQRGIIRRQMMLASRLPARLVQQAPFKVLKVFGRVLCLRRKSNSFGPRAQAIALPRLGLSARGSPETLFRISC